MVSDLRQAIRTIGQARAWSAVVVLSLALGIGANTAMFSAVNGLLLQTLPVAVPDTLVRFRWAGRNDMTTDTSDYGYSGTDAAGRDIRAAFSYPMFRQFLTDQQTLADLYACAPLGRVNVVVDGQADLATAFISTGNYYRVLGVSAQLGRTLAPDDDRPGAPPAAVIGHRYWRSRFAGDPGIIGRNIQINGVLATIVGVLPEHFTGVQRAVARGPDVALPLALDPLLARGPDGFSRLDEPTAWWLQIMGRMKPGVTPAQVQANLAGVFRQTARAGLDAHLASLPPAERSLSFFRNRTEIPELIVDSGSRGVYDAAMNDVRSVRILGVVVALVLLVVCANVANLLLSRTANRQRELSVRLSLGATRTRLIRLLLGESLVLAVLGGALGIPIGYWGQRLLPGAPGQSMSLDWRAPAFAMAVSVLAAVVFGLVPALRAANVNVGIALNEGSRTIAGSRSRLSRGLLIAQIAVSLVLLAGAGLFLRTVENLRRVDVGFNPRQLLLFRMTPQLAGYDEMRTRVLYEQLLERLRAVPGIQAAALSQPALLSGSVNSTRMYVQGRRYPAGRQHDGVVNRLVVSPQFFEALEMPLLRGRGFTERDHADAPKVAVINEAAARTHFPDRDALGRRFGTSAETSDQIEIVGVLRDVRYNSLREPAPPTIYVPYTQHRTPSAVVALRTAGDPLAAVGAVREAVRQLEPQLPLMDVSSQEEQIERRFLDEKLFARAYALFGSLALLVAAVGLFGLMSYSVARRTNEIGVRMAVGAAPGDVLRQIMGESMMMVALGLAIGLAAALAAGRYVETLLYGVAPTDAAANGLAAAVLLLVATIAGYLPARRAARVDPIDALRHQ